MWVADRRRRTARPVTLVIFTLAIFHQTCGLAQTNLLAIPVTLNVRDKTLSEVLVLISAESAIPFSYNPKKIPARQVLSYSCTSKPLAAVLNDLSRMTAIRYELVEHQIILRPEKKSDVETITVSGYVKDVANGEALIGATVVVFELNTGAVSNGFGFFSLTLPKGSYTLSCSFIGYSTISTPTDLRESVQQDILLTQKPAVLGEIVVSDIGQNIISDGQVSKLTLKPSAVQERPALFGETDVVKSLESIPGIKLHSDGSTFYYVRGGNRDQNLLLLDDAPIYNPSHLLGLFSTIVPDVINDITLYKGNMPASLGGRISSVLDIRTKKGNDQQMEGWGSAGLISTKLGIEGPITKNKSSFLVSARASRLQWFFHLLDHDISKFNFYDINAKANFRLNGSNRIFFSMYAGADNYFVNNSGIAWKNNTATFRWNHTVTDKLFINTTLAGGSYDYSLYTDVFTDTRWTSHISSFNLKSDGSYFIAPKNEVTFGVSINGYNFNPGNFDVGNALSVFHPVSTRNSSEFVLYGNHEITLNDRWEVSYGLRVSSWTDMGPAFEFVYDQNHNPIDTMYYKKGQHYKNYFNAEPRATIRFLISENSSFKAGFARNAQNIHLITNSTSPFTSMEVWLPSSLNIQPQIANQGTIGYYHTVTGAGVVLEAEGFYKKMFHQIDYAPHAETLLNPLLESQLRFGNAIAYGVELLAKKDIGRVRGLAGYTYSRAKRKFADLNGGQTFNAFSDRPHQISLQLAYDISLRWNLGMNWNYSTGAPYSAPVSFYKFNDQEVPVYGAKNNERLPAYHRMDASATFKLNKNPEKKFSHSLTFSVFNLYGRKNALFINYNKIQNAAGDFKVPANLLDANRMTSQFYLFRFTPSVSYNFKWK